MRPYIPLALLSSLALAACGGGAGSGGSNPNPGNPGGTGATQTQSAGSAIASADSIGTPLKNFAAYDAAVSTTAVRTAAVGAGATGSCKGGVEFFAPDRAGDPNSTETIWFYDAACAQPARDQVRRFISTGSASETVAVTTQLYAAGNATPIAVRTDANAITGASFDANGFPIPADGFYRASSQVLKISGSKTTDSQDELVILPQSGASETFCSDSAGYNATGFPALDETFGWQGMVASGTRTPNANGTVTWSATHDGTNFSGPIGSLSIAAGTANATCPIATPMFTLAGGSATGAYTLPITATYLHGLLVGLTIANATLANGNTLNVATNSSVQPTNALFVQGSVSNAGSQIAGFNVDAFGDGTLTVTATGKQYVITDWQVVR